MLCGRPETYRGEKKTLVDKYQIPIVDVSTDICPLRPAEFEMRRIGEEIYRALTSCGMALIVNHGISCDKLREMYEAMDMFCALPETNREKYRRDDTKRGYMRPGDEGSKTARHLFDMRSPTDLPHEVPGWDQRAQQLAQEFTKLSQVLLKAMATVFVLPLDDVVEYHSGMMAGSNNETTMRVLLYPPGVAAVNPVNPRKGSQFMSRRFVACGPHYDNSTFTLLAQDSEGLEVMQRGSEKWQPVGHLRGAIFLLPGKLLARMTENLIPAMRHRDVVPTSWAKRNRHCVAFFCRPDSTADFPPLSPRPLRVKAIPSPQPRQQNAVQPQVPQQDAVPTSPQSRQKIEVQPSPQLRQQDVVQTSPQPRQKTGVQPSAQARHQKRIQSSDKTRQQTVVQPVTLSQQQATLQCEDSENIGCWVSCRRYVRERLQNLTSRLMNWIAEVRNDGPIQLNRVS